jgi:hypothetical protein
MVFKNGDCIADDSLGKSSSAMPKYFRVVGFLGRFLQVLHRSCFAVFLWLLLVPHDSVSIEKRINRDTECGQDGMDKRDRRLASDWDNGNASGFKRTKRHFVAIPWNTDDSVVPSQKSAMGKEGYSQLI